MTFLYLLYWSLKSNRKLNYPELLPYNYLTEGVVVSVWLLLSDPYLFLPDSVL